MRIKINKNKITKNILLAGLSVSIVGFSALSVALPQVEEVSNGWSSSQPVPQPASNNNSSESSKEFEVSQDPSLDMAQRISIVEQSLNNINQMDFPSQMAHLEQEIQQLQGTVDVLEHKLQVLQAQQKKGAQDLSNNVQALDANSQHVSGSETDNSQQDDLDLAVASASSETSSDMSTKAAVNQVDPNLPAAVQEKRTYDAAFSLVQAHAYDDAISAFHDGYLKIYGDEGKYSANAYYWLGELYAHQQQYDKAQAALLTVVNKYPQSNKAADSMLKLGIIEQKQGDQAKANQWLQKVIKNYPNTSSARLAKNYLH